MPTLRLETSEIWRKEGVNNSDRICSLIDKYNEVEAKTKLLLQNGGLPSNDAFLVSETIKEVVNTDTITSNIRELEELTTNQLEEEKAKVWKKHNREHTNRIYWARQSTRGVEAVLEYCQKNEKFCPPCREIKEQTEEQVKRLQQRKQELQEQVEQLQAEKQLRLAKEKDDHKYDHKGVMYLIIDNCAKDSTPELLEVRLKEYLENNKDKCSFCRNNYENMDTFLNEILEERQREKEREELEQEDESKEFIESFNR